MNSSGVTHGSIEKCISGFFSLLGIIPRFIAVAIANWVGRAWFFMDAKHRRIAINNLTMAFGHEKNEEQIRLLARSTFMQLARVMFEVGWNLRSNTQKLKGQIQIQGQRHLSAALGKSKGVLFLTAHIGNWEMLPVIAALTHTTVSIVYRPLDFSPLNRFFEKNRSRFGAKLIPSARSMRKILSTLNKGEAVAMLMDQNVDWYEGVFADFFGHLACTNKGMALIARKTDAPVVPVFLIRKREGFCAEIGPELPFVRTGDKTKDIETNTAIYNRMLESIIRKYPNQWFWVHQRWKTKPYQPWPRRTNGAILADHASNPQ